jgi:hypothetical protein
VLLGIIRLINARKYKEDHVNHFKAVAFAAMVLGLTGFGQQAYDPIPTLQSAKKRLLLNLDRMPRYTCVQTVTRRYYDARSGAHGSSCSALITALSTRKHPVPAFGWDRLRLEVAWVEGNNVYSWVGEPRFADDNLEKLAGEGPLGSGDFGALLREILLQTTLDFERELFIDGKHLLEYSYNMPVEKSTYRVKTSDGRIPIAYSGTLLLDPETQDLMNFTMRVPNLPQSSSVCMATTEISYGRTAIHGRLALIPRETNLDVLSATGTESISETDFTNCREYASTVRFLDNSTGSTKQKTEISAVEPPTTLPAGLAFDARITTLIDSDTAAAGDPVEAVLRSPIRGNHNTVLVPAGARIRGRLTDVRWRSKPTAKYEVTVRFESVESEGRKATFSAVLEPPHSQVLTGTFSGSRLIPLKTDDPAIGSTFSFRQEHLRVKNLDARWVTVASKATTEEK